MFLPIMVCEVPHLFYGKGNLPNSLHMIMLLNGTKHSGPSSCWAPPLGNDPSLALYYTQIKIYIGASKFQRTVQYMVLNKVLMYHMGQLSKLQGFDILSILFFSFKCGPSDTNHPFAELDFISLKSIASITPSSLWFSDMASIRQYKGKTITTMGWNNTYTQIGACL